MKTRTLIVRSAALLALLAGASVSSAQCGATKITPQTKSDSEGFGNALSFGLSNGEQRLVVGAQGYDGAPYLNSGKVYLMGRVGNQWGELSSVLKPEAAYHGDLFGHSVGYSDPYLVVGCPGDHTNSGKVYFFERFGPTWTPVSQLDYTQFGQRLGESVAIDGQWAIAGSPDFDWDGNPGTPGDNNAGAGAAYILKRQANGTWAVQQTVYNNAFTSLYVNSALGTAVAMKGTLAVVGVPSGNIIAQGSNSGWIQVLRRDANGTYQSEGNQISSAAGRNFTEYGKAVATDGTRIIVGAPKYSLVQSFGDPADVSSAGAAFVMKFQGGQWVTEARLLAPTPTGSAEFGSSVAIDGDRALVGAAFEKKAYLYRRLASGSWVIDRVYSDEDAAAGGAFGSAVALGSGNAFVGDVADDVSPTTDNGAVYIKPLPTESSDTCEGAIAIDSGTHGTCTLELTNDGYVPCAVGAGGPGPDVWFAWTPACSGNVIIDTFGSDYDTVLSVHTGCPSGGNANLVACNDDGFPSPERDSLVTFDYTAGTRYLVRVGGYNAAAKGNLVLRVVEYQTPGNNNCSAASKATVGTTAFKTCRSTTDGPVDDQACVNDEDITNDVWFKYTAISGGPCLITTAGSSFDTILQVFPGASCPNSNAQAIACNDDVAPGNVRSSVSPGLVAGQTYLIRVGGYRGAVGDAALTISPACPCDYNGVNGTDLLDIFDFLTAWFANNNSADFNGTNGVDLLDIFAFLTCWFAGCN
jgi:hypothetical protein